ncbi:helix-turn-helix domain-containing protein [Streptomyces sp. SID13666]|uniref:GlxA family transcriptional regulator n=1 Tax=Streptomyces TaxID=1883 RepID=UPI00110651A5|nr:MULTISPECIES: helix-turn-helix domain-containing protein [Streptomyces]NEA56144.1 helix-turn-helix domain-containing protein [Streptomyces sp. SID13666]NEA71815.1 helix-turn-helix domain-containing protein [Streptomyces sp. SID13588]QNA77136.1 helix-turn-helix domain-containing protein [Streptomyces sp. So13.3]
MHRVVVLALEGVYPFELSIPMRIFGTAAGRDGEALYEVITCSLDGEPVSTSADFTITVAHGSEALRSADTLVIPPFACGPDEERDWLPDELAQALALLPPGARIVSICTASYVLAAAGLLDGRSATTHWNEADHFQRTFPKIQVDANVLFVDDGQVLTAAGVAAGIDLCLHLVRRDHGSDIANQVARLCVVPPWREGGQAQYIERPMPQPSAATTAATRDWALQQLQRPISLAELAEHARMSVRTFCRRFHDEVGMPPGQWLAQQRVGHARRLLETTDLPVDQVAAHAGFGTAVSLRQHLATTIGVSPTAYRQAFRAR